MSPISLFRSARPDAPRSRRPGRRSLLVVDATELFDGLSGLAGSRDAGATNGISASRLVNGVEYAHAATMDERRLRAAWKRRWGGGAVPLLLIADDPEGEGRLRVLGPQPEGPVRRIRAESLLGVISRSAGLRKLEAVRQVAQEVERLDTEGVAGLAVRGLGSEHLYAKRLPRSKRWGALVELTEGLSTVGWREVLSGLGYEVTSLSKRGYLASSGGKPVIVVHPRQSADQFARLDEAGRLPEGALVADCLASGAPYGVLAAGVRMRLLRAGRDEAGSTMRYLELDPAAMEPEFLPLVGLLAPAFLASGGFEELLVEARDYGSSLRKRLDRSLRQDVLPVLGRELGRWATASGRDVADDEVRSELEAAALTWVFRALFLLYAESAGHLPMSNHTYAGRSFTRIAERAAEELDVADENAKTLWRDVSALVEAMRTGQSAWGVPAYNGALFAPDGFDGAEILEAASIPDAALAPALVALARDRDDPDNVGVDFSDLEIGHLGHIYEGLLSLRLSVADRDFRYDAKSDRYVPASGEEVEIGHGDLLWLTNEGGRKGGGVYYTRTELVRHLVREAVRPAFAQHLGEVRELASDDPRGAAHQLFEFFVLDPACGSAHFLVEVVEELADQIATLLGDLALPAVREELDGLRRAAGSTFGAGIEDTALLKRLVLKRCVYGVDLSRMGAEIAKVSLWLGSFVPGLSLAYLDHNVRVGNSLIGVVRPESMRAPGTEHGQVVLFGDALSEAVAGAAERAARLRAIDDRTPTEVEASRSADAALHDTVAAAERVLDLWVAQPLGLRGARDEALQAGNEIIAGGVSLLGNEASELARRHSALHWPLAFAEVFARERPGFDVVVGNPPWEEVVIEELAFYALYRPGLRSMPEKQRRAEMEALKAARPELPELLVAWRERLKALRDYLSPAGGFEGSAGDPDVYKFFCQRYRELLRSGGRLGVVLPRSVFVAKGSAGFRSWLFEHAALSRIDFLVNNRLWMFDTHPQYTVALLAAERRSPKSDDALEVAGVARSAAQFMAQSLSSGLRLRSVALGPALEIPLLRSQAEADLLGKLRVGSPFSYGGGRWRCFPVAEFHETADAHLWEGATTGRPLWKGESFDQFNPHGAEARMCPASEEALAKALKPRPGAKSLLADEVPLAARRQAVERTLLTARVAFRDVSRATDSRTVRTCLVPPEHFLVNSAPYLVFIDEDAYAQAMCVALMNSLVFDWQARRFVETHLNFFVLEGLRLPDLDQDTFDALAATAAWLSCPDDRFADFAVATEVEVEQIDDDERTRLRAEIDAGVAQAWRLTPAELELVFDDFTEDAVPLAYREAVRQRFAA
jgi:hypothetical protein